MYVVWVRCSAWCRGAFSGIKIASARPRHEAHLTNHCDTCTSRGAAREALRPCEHGARYAIPRHGAVHMAVRLYASACGKVKRACKCVHMLHQECGRQVWLSWYPRVRARGTPAGRPACPQRWILLCTAPRVGRVRLNQLCLGIMWRAAHCSAVQRGPCGNGRGGGVPHSHVAVHERGPRTWTA